MTDNVAVLAGYTVPCVVEVNGYSFPVLVKPRIDYNKKFRAFDQENRAFILIEGFNCDVYEEKTA